MDPEMVRGPGDIAHRLPPVPSSQGSSSLGVWEEWAPCELWVHRTAQQVHTGPCRVPRAPSAGVVEGAVRTRGAWKDGFSNSVVEASL